MRRRGAQVTGEVLLHIISVPSDFSALVPDPLMRSKLQVALRKYQQ
jgi:hypothetical protein